MAVNPYFKKDYSGQQDIVEELTIEIIKTMGRDMIYIPRNILETDLLFGEGNIVNYNTGIPLEMYIDSVSGFDGQGDISTKFGIEIKDNINLTLSKKRFNQEITNSFSQITRPREGDLIYFPLAKALFEINFVEHENPFYQFGKLFCYKLICELFTYNQEEISTGNTDIDSVQEEHQEAITILQLTNISGQTLSLYQGETIYQVDGITGNLATIDKQTMTAVVLSKMPYLSGNTASIEISNINGTLKTSDVFTQTIKGSSSNLEFYATSKTISQSIAIKNNIGNVLEGDNDILSLENEIKNVINYSETDPFSEGKY